MVVAHILDQGFASWQNVTSTDLDVQLSPPLQIQQELVRHWSFSHILSTTQDHTQTNNHRDESITPLQFLSPKAISKSELQTRSKLTRTQHGHSHKRPDGLLSRTVPVP